VDICISSYTYPLSVFDVLQLCYGTVVICRPSVLRLSVTDVLWLSCKGSAMVLLHRVLATSYRLFRFLRTTAECFAHLSHRLGVRLSVRQFITPWHCIKMVQAKITKSSL